MSDSNIEQLIAKIALSNRKAFDDLYLAVSPKLFAVLMRILKNREHAEDGLQEVFVKIWQKASSYRAGQQAPIAWLVTIARNHAIDVIRANKRIHDDIDDHYELKSPEPTPEQASINAGERGRIDNCLEELEPQKAEAVVSAYVEGYSYQELADRYSIPLNTMRTWLRRSLLSLKDCLDNG
ncbi:MAG: sigma-70 family RNA polymerase sigma factor [Salaquimonas sp.]